MNISQFIFKNNLYDTQTNAYVQLFTNGSDFFWEKIPAKTEFLNDVNCEIYQFLNDVRREKFDFLTSNPIFNRLNLKKLTFENIIESDLFKRLNNTYIMNRNFKDLIKVTDDIKTFYYCECENLTVEIFEELDKIKGKYLIIGDKNILKKFKNKNNYLINKEYSCLINYKINTIDDLLF